MSSSIVRGLFVAAFLLVAACDASAQVSITSPASPTRVFPGETISVQVSVPSNIHAAGVQVAASVAAKDQDNSLLTPLIAAPPYNFSITVPANMIGRVNLVAIALTGPDAGVTSQPVILDSEPTTVISNLSVDIQQLTFGFIGQQRQLLVTGVLSGGTPAALTHSLLTTYVSSNPSVATVGNPGVVTAVGAGTAKITVSWVGQVASVNVTVPQYLRGDLNGDGRVNQDDVNILTADLGNPVNGPGDARDLNGDGAIDEVDLTILKSLVTTDFSVSVSPTNTTASTTQAAHYTVTITPVGGAFGNAVALTCSNLPKSTSCSFSQSSVTPGAVAMSSMLTISESQALMGPGKTLPGGMLFCAVALCLFAASLMIVFDRTNLIPGALLALGCIVLCFGCLSPGSTSNSSSPTSANPTTSSFVAKVIGTSGKQQHSSLIPLTLQ